MGGKRRTISIKKGQEANKLSVLKSALDILPDNLFEIKTISQSMFGVKHKNVASKNFTVTIEFDISDEN